MSRVITCRARADVFEQLAIEADSLDAASSQTPNGVYTVFPIFEGWRVVRLDRHLERLYRSAELLGEPLIVSEVWLRATLRRAVESVGLETQRVRLTIPLDAPDTAYISVEPYTPPDESLYDEGVRVVTVGLQRPLPRAKNSQFISARRALLRSLPPDIHEGLLCSREGEILEGTSSNFYAVLGGELRTADEGVLEGVARSILLDVAPEVLPVRLEPVRVDALDAVSEAMITSASRGVIPIVEIDGRPLGDGRPGRIFKALRVRYNIGLQAEMEPL
jgi:branched-chain amino acid aminotransferase